MWTRDSYERPGRKSLSGVPARVSSDRCKKFSSHLTSRPVDALLTWRANQAAPSTAITQLLPTSYGLTITAAHRLLRWIIGRVVGAGDATEAGARG